MKGERGFTLMEVLISLLILGGVVVTAVSALNRRIDLVQRQRDELTAALLAREKLTSSPLPSEGEGSFAPTHPGYRWVIRRFPAELPGLTRIVLTVTWGDDRSYRLVTYGFN